MLKIRNRLSDRIGSGLIGLGMAVTSSFIVIASAQAQSRYVERPPVVLSPDLTEPWQLQLATPQRARVVVRSSRSYTPAAPRRAVERTERVAPPATKKRSVQSALALNAPAQQQIRAAREAPARQSLPPQFLPQIVEYNTSQAPGTIVIDTNNRYLYLVLANGEARRYGVGVGKPGFEWAGTHKVTRKAEWPSWRPPAAMIARERAKGRILPTFMEGGPENPLGARSLYLGSTLYRIHGTNAPWSIGQAVSSGCIRMRNEDVEDLYTRVGVGTKVIVI